MAPAPAFRSRVVTPRTDGAAFERAGLLTPYTAEGILTDALGAGRGARLQIDLAPTIEDRDLAAIRRQFAWLAIRQIEVNVQRRLGQQSGAGRPGKASP